MQEEQEQPIQAQSAIDRLLTPAERKKVARTAARLDKRLVTSKHVWVRDARTLRHGVESSVPYFSLRVTPTTPIADIRHDVQEAFERLSSYSREREGPLGLSFDGRVLRDDQPLATYLSGGNKGHWASPYLGIIWVIPWRRPT